MVGGRNGLVGTTATRFDVAVSADATAPDAGFGLNFDAIGAMSANGFTNLLNECCAGSEYS